MTNTNYIQLALENEEWQQIEASFALEGMKMDDADRDRAGIVIAGVITSEEAVAEVRAAHEKQASLH